MKFKANTRRRALEYEKDWVEKWKKDQTFEKSIENRSKDNGYVFYDGPPFITGVPHHGTLLSSIVKDAVPRYQTMKGKRVERVWGWDCHGLPAEVFTEKKLGIQDRRDIGTKISLEKYITTARENMVTTGDLWESYVDRIGRWVDFKGAYKTMDKEYMESIWWAFKTLYEKKKIYEGERVLMYCTRDATPLSKAEVTMDAGAYQDVTDPSVYVKFELQEELVIRRLNLSDTNDYEKFSKLTQAWPNYASNIKKFFEKQRAFPFVAEIDNEAVGIATLMLEGWEKDKAVRDNYRELPEFNGLWIDEKYRRRGIGKKLSIAIENEAYFQGISVIGLGVETDNEAAIGLYKKLGYEQQEVDSKDFFETTWTEKNENNKPHEYSAKCYLMTKQVAHTNTKVYLLAWTTTPWTLLANTALAINKNFEYSEVRLDDERFVIAKELVEKVLRDEKHQPLAHEVLRTFKGEELVGLGYKPLFENHGKNAHKVWNADYVSAEDGTGIVHIAPAYGEEDFALAQENNIPVVHTLDESGFYTDGEWKGQNVWEVNKQIAKTLHEQGVVWKIDYIRHSYPHCHRCGTKLMYRAHPSWFFDVQGQKQLMLEKNGSQIEWFPEHLKHGRFEKNIEQAPDWNLSRDRFWATAMPVWEGVDSKGKKHQIVVGSYAELKELSGVELEDYHRPWVDDIEFEKDGVHYKRIDKVLDGWFESGSMPFAQFHYPFENKEKFEANFPGDFIVEYIGQVRAWFYYMHTISVGLFGESSFRNVITTGVIAGNDGRKMSKSYGNYTDPNELMDKFSADSLRFLLMSSPLLKGEDFSLQDKDVGDVARKLSMIWNMYDFFTMYAEVDGWEYDGKLSDPLEDLTNPLDIWIISRLHQLVGEVETHMDKYNIPEALAPILPFLDDASNWYVRRSRRRFWKSEDDGDKNDAYKTLHYVLVRLAYVLAPFTPFLAEELYSKLTGEKESIHLKDWLPAGHVDQIALDEMKLVREVINEGLSQRASAGIKVRQPLSRVDINIGQFLSNDHLLDIINDELNVKHTVQGIEQTNGATDFSFKVVIDLEITPELKREGLIREVIRHVQSARKKAELNVDDRIKLSLVTEDKELTQAIKEHQGIIVAETLAETIDESEYSYSETVAIEGNDITVSLEKYS